MTITLLSERAFGTLPSVTRGDTTRLAALPDGRVAQSWTQPVGDPSEREAAIFARLADADGVPLTEAVRVDAGLEGNVSFSAVAPLGDGFAVAFVRTVQPTPTTLEADIVLRRFDADGAALGDEIVVTPPVEGEGLGSAFQPTLLGLADGTVLVAYGMPGLGDSRARVVFPDGTAGEPVVVSNGGIPPQAAQLANGDVVLASFTNTVEGVVLRLSGPDLTSAPQGGGDGPLTIATDVSGGDAGRAGLDVASTSDGGFAVAIAIAPGSPRADQVQLRVAFFEAVGTAGTVVTLPLEGDPAGLRDRPRLEDAGDGRVVAV